MGEGSAFQEVRRQEHGAWMQKQSGSPRVCWTRGTVAYE